MLPVDNKIPEHYDDIKAAFADNPSIVSVGGAYEEPTHIGWSDGIDAGTYDETKRYQ